MSKLADDERFKNVDPLVANIANDITDTKLKLNENEKGKIDMCVALQELRVDWKNEGINEGAMNKAIDAAKIMLSKKFSLEDISECLGLSLEKVKELSEEVNNK